MHGDWPASWGDAFDDSTRLYRIEAEGPLSDLLADSWSLREALSEPWRLQLNTLSPRADLDLHDMLARPVALHTVLSDGSRHTRRGIVTGARASDPDGGVAPYHLTVQPWLALLTMTRRSQAWQERSVVQIIESVFSRYAQHAAWRWADDCAGHWAASPNAGMRSYLLQYRETDFDFVQRVLAEEGIAYRFEPCDEAPLGHRLVLFADSVSTASCPEDASSRSALGGLGIRFHGAAALEEQDTIQSFFGERQLQPATVAMAAWDYKAKRVVAASVPTMAEYGGPNVPRLEHYDHAGAYAFATTAEAERAGRLMQEAIEARHKRWIGQGTVRSFSAGLHFTLTQSTLDALGEDASERRFLLTSVVHVGINNLPAAMDRVKRLALEPWVDEAMQAQARRSGYANRFEAIRAKLPWRPMLVDETGARLHPKPTVPGPLMATVVGPRGQTRGTGADEIHADALGRVRIRFEFQGLQAGPDTSQSSTWVRVMQRYAGARMGLQFIPRVGQEVLVDFMDGDIDRPVVIASLYNGRGQGGVAATPGGKDASRDTSVFKDSHDHAPSGQANLSGGNSPAWHGASGDEAGQRNAGALSGFKSREFGGVGFNQLVLDDSDRQLRVQMASTQFGSQLNLGHLIHQADNHRGSFRGLGFELRTDAYGAVRGGRGVLISSFGNEASEPAGDNAAGIAMALQAFKLGELFSGAAKTHETVQLAGHIGSFKPWQSTLDAAAAPLKAMQVVLKGMVAGQALDAALMDAAERNTGTQGKVPHVSEPVVAIAAKAGLGIVAGQDVQVAAGETASFVSGQDTHWAVGGALRVHTGQAIGVLAGAIKAGDQAAGTGISLIAAKGDIEVQAQAGAMQVAGKKDVTVQSANAHVDWAAAKRIVLSTAGGASITIGGGDVIVACPGTITVRASKKSFMGAAQETYPIPVLPQQICVSCLLRAAASGAPFAMR